MKPWKEVGGILLKFVVYKCVNCVGFSAYADSYAIERSDKTD